MKPFRERNPVIIGAISLAAIAAVILLSFRAQDLPLIGGGDTYYAAFSEAGGLKVNDEVRIAGVRVGKVESIELDGNQVRVGFRVDTESQFGSETRAAIKVKTLLGAMFLALEPAGSGPARRGGRDPGRAHDVAVRRRRGLPGTGRDLRAHRHRPAGRVDDGARRPDPQHSRGVPRGPRAGCPRCRPTSPPATSQINSLLRNLGKVSGILDERDEDIIELMQRLRRAVPRRRRPSRVRAQPAGVDVAALEGADAAGQAEPGRPEAGAGAPRERRGRAEQERGQPRQQPAADGAVLPGLRQHPRHRPVVRHVHPEPPAGPGGR